MVRAQRAPRWQGAAALLLLAFAMHGCEDDQIKPPLNEDAVVWTRLTNPVFLREPFFPEWRGETILFEYQDVNGNFNLGYMNEDGTDPVLLAEADSSSDIFHRWVTDGIVVFSSNLSGISYDLWYREIGTNQIRRLTGISAGEFSPAPRPGRPSLAYTLGNEPLAGTITLIPDTAAVPLTRISVTPPNLLAGEADWDPAGNRICFSADAGSGSRHIWLAYLTNTAVDSLVRLTTGGAHDLSPRFSPDGTKIVFTSDRTGRSGVWWVSPQGEGTALKLISFEDQGASVYTPSWSPDGTRLVVSSDGRGGRAIWLLSNLGF